MQRMAYVMAFTFAWSEWIKKMNNLNMAAGDLAGLAWDISSGTSSSSISSSLICTLLHNIFNVQQSADKKSVYIKLKMWLTSEIWMEMSLIYQQLDNIYLAYKACNRQPNMNCCYRIRIYSLFQHT